MSNTGKPRIAIRLSAITIALMMVCNVLLSSNTSFAARQPKITWSQKQVSVELSPGGGATKQLTFTSDQNLQNITIEAVPEIASFVHIQPAAIATVFADQSQSVSLFFSIPTGTAFGLHEGTIHVREGSRTIPQTLKVSIEVKQGVELPPELSMADPLSPARVSLSGVSEKTFNPQSSTIGFGIGGGTFDTDPMGVRVFLNGLQSPATSVQVTQGVITVSAFLNEGRNEVSLFAFDAEGRIVHKAATLWAGSYTLPVFVYDENFQPATGALVTARLGDDKEVKAAATSVNGSVSFVNLPNWTTIVEASASGNRIASVATNGGAGFAQLVLRGFNQPSAIDNNDFSQGLAGWETGFAPVQIIPHDEGTFVPLQTYSATQASFAAFSSEEPATSKSVSQASVSRAERHAQLQASGSTNQASNALSTDDSSFSALSLTQPDSDLMLGTSGEGPQTISRTFTVEPGVQEIKVRYKFVTSEVPGGYFGTQYNDYFNLSIRTQTEGGAGSESQTMNGLGLAAFDAGGATDWREFTLPVNENGDTIQVDATVANVADGFLDSQLVLDFVAKPKVKIGDLVAVIKNDTKSVEVKMSSDQPTTVTLTLAATEGTGTAQFTSNNSTTMTITQTTTVEIKGITESSTRNNIRVQANDDQGEKIDDEDFSVLWVTLSLRTSGNLSSDNDARATIGEVQGNTSPTLGTVYHSGARSARGNFWGNATEIVGTIAPSNFEEKIKLERQRIATNVYYGANNVLEAGNSGGVNLDTSPDSLRDDDPRPNGRIYDYDAPGIPTLPPSAAVGTTRRQRINFREWAVYDGKKASADFLWFSRMSIERTAGRDAINTAVAGDNVSGAGATPLTWNLQP